MNVPKKFQSSMRVLTAACLLTFASGAGAAVAPNDPPDLSITPPDLSQTVDPNIVVTFDDSGSMQANRMGDDPPYGSSSWDAGPWRCAAVVDPDHPSASDAVFRATTMNGVYYNPTVNYSPPLYEDGTGFPKADVALKKVWVDGINVNRPLSPVTADSTAGYNNNPDLNHAYDTDNDADSIYESNNVSNAGAVTDMTGTATLVTQVMKYVTFGTVANCPADADAGTCIEHDSRFYSGDGLYRYYFKNEDGSTGGNDDPATVHFGVNLITTSVFDNSVTRQLGDDTSATAHYITWDKTGQFADSSKPDNRWKCGIGPNAPANTGGGDMWDGTSPMDNAKHTLSDSTEVTYPNGGPYYYRLKKTIKISVDKYGVPDATGLSALYNAANWEAVPVTKKQNFANWYAYYRTRNDMTRSALSRVFAVLGGDIRVAWQNINSNFINSNTIITNMRNNGTPVNYRKSFFNWIFSTGASGNTPNRRATIRTGEFFSRGYANNATDPYYDPGSKRDLGCRQNFHMLVTDGYWNTGNGDPTTPTGFFTADAARTLPDGTAYDVTAPQSQVYWDTQGATYTSSLANIGFYYWAHDLRPDLNPDKYTTASPAPSTLFPAKVPTFVKDTTTGITTATSASVADKKLEVYYNPANDPADWRHIVQFMVTLGIAGDLQYSDDVDCTNLPSDMCQLRKGKVNSSGGTGWSTPANNQPSALDDTWHAAVNSRGSYFSAANPSALVAHLIDIITNIAARSGQSSSAAVSTSILNQGAVSYRGGYNSSGWTGYLYKQALDPETAATVGNPSWDAGCFLTLGICAATGLDIKATTPEFLAPDKRVIFTSVGSAGSLVGKPFQWDQLGTAEQAALKLDPATTHPDTTTTLVPTTNGTSDDNGSSRLEYLRGDRTYETAFTSSTTNPVRFRRRGSVLGAIIGSQAHYLGAPSGGHLDAFPAGSPEQTAAASGDTYEKFVKDNLTRNPMIYVGANDGMLHAFNASTGKEVWAFVPHTLYANGQLDQLTNPANNLVVTVDDSPISQDVFTGTPTSAAAWRTMLVGSLRLGGRGIYALDVTDSASTTESGASGKFMWEFSSDKNADTSDLGYTYSSANIARIRCNKSPCEGAGTVGGTWVVLVSGGYFPQTLPGQANGNSATDTAAGVTNTTSYLWVLNAKDGSVIKKIPTPSGVSYGMSTPDLVDFGLDQIDDIAVAGDLAGNLWRFDLSDPDPANWKVDQMFKTYTNDSPCSASNPHGVGCEPISVMPVAFPDAFSGSVIYVFGSGQYLGNYDRTDANVFTPQHFFGVRDLGAASASYPLTEDNLATRTISQTASGVRTVSATAVAGSATPQEGWMIPLNISGISGERDIVTVLPLYTVGAAILVSLIPGQNNDPCTPGRSGAVMAINASSGGVLKPLEELTKITGYIGGLVTNPPALGGPIAITKVGGGTIILPGMGGGGGGGGGPGDGFDPNKPPDFQGLTPNWRRTSWKNLLNNL